MTKDQTHFYETLSAFQRLYHKSLVMRLSPYGVQPGYLHVLRVLWEKDGITQKELNANLEIEQATLSNTLQRMERDGLITRTALKTDRRRQTILLSDKARQLQTTVAAALEDLNKTVNVGLTINDLKYFKRIMNQMIGHLEDDQSESLLVLLDEV